MATFSDLLTNRLLLSSITWDSPLPVQRRSIEHILAGKNVFIRSRTGSGKTAAFVLPILDRMLSCDYLKRTVLLAPTRELANQLKCVVLAFLDNQPSTDPIRLFDLNLSADASSVSDGKEILIGTPSRLVAFSKTDKNRHCDILVVDEADLIIGMELDRDLKKIRQAYGQPDQLVLASATLDEESSEDFTKLLCGAVTNIVHVSQKRSLPDQLEQFRIDCNGDQDKFVLLVALLKLGILQPPPMIVFTSSTNRSYRLRLVLERFGLKCLTLNAELPQQCQLHTVEQFNRGIADIMICTDQKGDKGHVCPRGLDFRSLSYVINFDCPTSTTDYVHRVGRTCRLDDNGAALTLVSTEAEHKSMRAIEAELNDSVKIFAFPRDEVSAFQYRVKDALLTASKMAVRRTRAHELRMEMIADEKLTEKYWASNARELELLKNSSRKALPLISSKRVFKHVPSYMVPKHLKIPNPVKISKKKKKKPAIRRNAGHPKRSCDPFTNTKRAVKKIEEAQDQNEQ